MVLKELVIQGFKSFPDKTKIEFHHGLTAVVGPNGSGKSNISDAIRWVMGEQSSKTLRGGKMEDVIFSGTKNRKPMTFAEVSLSIDNRDRSLLVDADEVVVTRRYHRSGESEYRINQKSVRLRDINELFMDTGLGKDGYAMVGQGRIDEIVRSKSDERRLIFEEAAGITKFRTRKQDAERRLAAAEDNLVRLRDILQELEDRLEPLKQQSEKAKRYLELASMRKTLEVSVWMQQLSNHAHQLKDYDDRMMARQIELEDTEARVAALTREMESARFQMQQASGRLDELRRKQETDRERFAELQAKCAVLTNNLEHQEKETERLVNEKTALQTDRLDFETSIQKRKEEMEMLSKQVEAMVSEIEEEERAVSAIQEEQAKTLDVRSKQEQALRQLLLKQSVAQTNLLQVRRQKTEESDQQDDFSRVLAQKLEQLAADERELSETKEFVRQLQDRTSELQNMGLGYDRRVQSKLEELNAARKAQTDLQMQAREQTQRAHLLEDLEKNFDGFSYSVKAILKRAKAGALLGICGTVSQILDVSPQYTVAVETALGFAQQNIVVETDRNAQSAIRFLQQQKAGRATFLPLNAVRGGTLNHSSLREEQGFVALASELVSFEEKYRPAVEFLLGRIAICEDLESATAIARRYQYKFRIVTLDGQVINAGGSMTGGSQNSKTQSFFGRKSEIQALHQKAAALERQEKQQQEKIAEAEQEYQQARAHKKAVDSELVTVREDQIRAEAEVRRLIQQLEQAKQQYDQLEQDQKQRDHRREELNRQEDSLVSELSEVKKQLEEHQNSCANFAEQEEAASRLLEEHLSRLSDLRLKRMERQKDLENAKRMLEDSIARGDELQVRLDALQMRLGEQQTLRQQYLSEQQAASGEQQKLSEEQAHDAQEMEQIQQSYRSLEASVSAARSEERDRSVGAERLRQELERFSERRLAVQKAYDEIIRKLWEEYELTRGEAEELAEPPEDLAAAEQELNAIKARIRALGSVNVSAVEEYQEVSERYHFLHQQVTDAEKARSELLRLIGDLTDEMKQLFSRSFEQINEHFKRIFVELFGGGRAELRLTDPEDLLGCGIEIIVEPPGKIIRNLTSLSGGEQAFVAVALYFSILNVRPAPFCVLDEIEAALDDVNVSKYAAYLRNLTDHTQFIAITHRRGTMEEADTLYGVTMQQEGVSKLLQLNVSEIEQTMASIGAN